MRAIVWVALGGAIGALARYSIGRWSFERWGGTFPFGTLIVNVTGSLLLGFLIGFLPERAQMPSAIRPFLAIGFCGAYTTFSTFSVDTIVLAEKEMFTSMIGNVVLNNGLSLSAAILGIALARLLPAR